MQNDFTVGASLQTEFAPGSVGHALGDVLTSRTEGRARRCRRGLPAIKSRKLYTVEADKNTAVDHVLLPGPGKPEDGQQQQDRWWAPLAECTKCRSRFGTTYYVHGDAPKSRGFVLTPPPLSVAPSLS